MKSNKSHTLAALAIGVMVLATGNLTRADESPPVEIKMPADTQQAVAGQEYAGVFHVRVYEPGVLADFQIAGEGWNVLAFTPPVAPAQVQPGLIEIPFRAVPADADKPIGLSLTSNGRRVRQAYEIGPAYFARAGKPYRSARVGDASVPAADAARLGSKGGGAGGSSGGDGTRSQLQFEGRIVYSRPGRDFSNPPDGDFDDPGDIPPVAVGADTIDVRVWDSDPVGHEEIWSGYTDENGYFVTPVIDWDDPGDLPDLVLYYETEVTGVVDVTDNTNEEWTYTFESDEITDFEGSYYNFGTHSPVDANLHPALHIFNSVVRTRRFIQEKPAYITPEVQVEWPDDSQGGGAWYERGPVEIHISTERQWWNDTVSHEYGHHFIVMTYDPDPPYPDYCNEICDPNYPDDCGHCMWCQETDHDAWNEGWPNWLADVVTRDYPNRYTHEPSGLPFVPLYTRSQETPLTCGGIYDDPILTEGYIGALLRDMEDQTQDDHDDDPDPNNVLFDGVFDLLCLGPVEIFRVTYLDQPITVTDFINAFLARYPEYTDLFWPTAFNVGDSAYVSSFPADTQPPGVVLSCASPTHPYGTGGSLPCITFEWWAAPDDASGASAYSFLTTTNPNGEEPDEVAEPVTGTNTCGVSGTVEVWELGQHYFCIKAQDNAGNWSSQWATFGPFEIIDCNGSGILDACDISCNHQGVSGICTISPSPCNGQPGCGLSNDCQPNLVPDECDIANGTSEDCNLNDVPDECENMFHWIGTSGSWHTPGNWLEGAEPNAYSHVCIDVGGSETITYSSDASVVATLACSENLYIASGAYPWADLTLSEASWVDGDLGLSANNTVLRVDDRLDIAGLFTWTGSNLSGSAKLAGPGVTYANGGVLISEIVHLDGHHLVLDGSSTSVSTTGRVDFISPAVFEIRPGSTYEHQGSLGMFNGWFGDQFINQGTLIKSVDPGTGSIYMFTNNSGLIHVQTGTLTFYLGGSSSGDFLADPGATLNFTGGHEFLPSSSIVAENVLISGGISLPNTVRGTYDVSIATTVQDATTLIFTDEANIISYGASFYIPRGTVDFNAIVSGTIQFDTLQLGTGGNYAGTANFNSGDPVQITTLNLGPGTVRGPGSITISGLTTWNGGGHFDGEGTGTVNANGDVLVNDNTNENTIRDCVFNNAGTVTLLGQISMPYSTVFNNLATGVIDIQADGGPISGLGQTLNNAGTMVKTAGSGTSTISVPTTNTGTVEVQMGVLEFYTYYSGYYVQTAGQTILNGGNLGMFGPAPVQIDGGLLIGAGTITGNVVNAGGTVEPGLSAGQLDVDGTYTQQTGGTLKAELGGSLPGEYDTLVCTGNASLAGNLEVVLINGFEPSGGDSFEILTAATVTGVFDNLILPGLPPGIELHVDYSATAVTLNAVVPGDTDGDGDVDLEDLAALLSAYGACDGDPNYNAAADFDSSGCVDLSDLATLLSNYGTAPD